MEHVKVVAKTIIDWFTEDNKEYRKTETGEEFISGGRVQTKPDILAKCYDLPNYCWSLCNRNEYDSDSDDDPDDTSCLP